MAWKTTAENANWGSLKTKQIGRGIMTKSPESQEERVNLTSRVCEATEDLGTKECHNKEY